MRHDGYRRPAPSWVAFNIVSFIRIVIGGVAEHIIANIRTHILMLIVIIMFISPPHHLQEEEQQSLHHQLPLLLLLLLPLHLLSTLS